MVFSFSFFSSEKIDRSDSFSPFQVASFIYEIVHESAHTFISFSTEMSRMHLIHTHPFAINEFEFTSQTFNLT